ncbi:MarR family winged helix-turn-helix transcriptional regulator [Micromonospora vulcania]|uniref:MarR family winged helix-turn-helix transcriptional regulator n=1 Tax=Micromonospora vulcania TaxID=1441873 RepID=A0ABW1H5W1_9ACTN
MSVQPVEPAEHRAGPMLDHLARRMRLRAESVLTPFALRPRHLVALTVLRAEGGISQQALASTLEMDATNIVGLLNHLEAGGLIERRRSATDRRRHVVEITDTGAKRLNEAECALKNAEDEVLAALDPTERESLYELLRRATTGTAATCSEMICPEPPLANESC